MTRGPLLANGRTVEGAAMQHVERKFPVFLIPPSKHDPSARQLKPRGLRKTRVLREGLKKSR